MAYGGGIGGAIGVWWGGENGGVVYGGVGG